MYRNAVPERSGSKKALLKTKSYVNITLVLCVGYTVLLHVIVILIATSSPAFWLVSDIISFSLKGSGQLYLAIELLSRGLKFLYVIYESFGCDLTQRFYSLFQEILYILSFLLYHKNLFTEIMNHKIPVLNHSQSSRKEPVKISALYYIHF